MGTTGSRLEHATSIDFVRMIDSGITLWIAFALILEAMESPHSGKTWFKLTTNVFVAFFFWVIFILHHYCLALLVYILICLKGSCLAVIYASILMLVPLSLLQQEIAEASDEVARKYYGETLEEEKSNSRVIAMMKAVAKTKHQSLKSQFSNFTAITNSKLGDQFLKEVCIFNLHL
jgi:hypothetical protein